MDFVKIILSVKQNNDKVLQTTRMLSNWFSRTIQRFTNKPIVYFLSKISYTLSNKTPKTRLGFVSKPIIWFPLYQILKYTKPKNISAPYLSVCWRLVWPHLWLIDSDCRVWTLRGRGEYANCIIVTHTLCSAWQDWMWSSPQSWKPDTRKLRWTSCIWGLICAATRMLRRLLNKDLYLLYQKDKDCGISSFNVFISCPT